MYFHFALSVQGPAAWPAVPLICLCLLKAVSVRVKLPVILSYSYFEGGEHKPARSPSYWSCWVLFLTADGVPTDAGEKS